MLDFKNINYGELKEKMIYKIKNYNIDYEEEEENDDTIINNFYEGVLIIPSG